MTSKPKPKPKCPACGKPAIKQDNAFFPFCTERCQLIDLGHWLARGSLDREEKLADRYRLLTSPGRNSKFGSSVTLAGSDSPSSPEINPENN